jgi:phosphate starvation-inducible protein PhoH
VSPRPTLVVVSGPAGSGKTTLAHAIASAVGCPASPEDPDRPAFIRIALDAPSLEVDTTDGYRPGLDQIVAFVNSPA